MRINEPILYRIKNKSQRLFFVMVGFDDDGIKMRSPMGQPIQGLLLGETLIASDGSHYMIKKIGMQSNGIWLEKISNHQNLAS
jgi:hypothetical protein